MTTSAALVQVPQQLGDDPTKLGLLLELSKDLARKIDGAFSHACLAAARCCGTLQVTGHLAPCCLQTARCRATP